MNGAPSVSTDQSRLPKQVRAAARRAADLQRQQQERSNGSDPSPQADPSGTPAVADPKAASTPQPSATTADPQAIADPKPTPTGAADPGALPGNGGAADLPQLDAAVKHWQNRYHSVMGVLRTEREQARDREAKLQAEVARLTAEIAKAQSAAPAAIDVKLEDHFTAEQIDALGEDRAAAIVRAAHTAALDSARREVEAKLAPIRQREEQEQQRQQQERERQQEDARQKFLDDLTVAVPNWATINATPEWLAWLAEFDDQAMRVRDQIIQDASAVNDSRPVIALLRKYLQERQPPARPQPSVQPSSRDVGGNPSTGGQTPQVAVKPMTPAEIKQAYTKLATRRDLSDEQRDVERAKLDALVKGMTQQRAA